MEVGTQDGSWNSRWKLELKMEVGAQMKLELRWKFFCSTQEMYKLLVCAKHPYKTKIVFQSLEAEDEE
jgi:hypothetical protein